MNVYCAEANISLRARAAQNWLFRSGLEADLCVAPRLRCTDNLRRAHTCQPHLQPADVAADVLRGRSAKGLDEAFVAGVERVHVLDVIAA